MENISIDDTFIYKVNLFNVESEVKETRFILAKNFEDASQLVIEMTKDNQLWVSRIKEIGYLDYASGETIKQFPIQHQMYELLCDVVSDYKDGLSEGTIGAIEKIIKEVKDGNVQ